jgi:IK cytokine
LKIESDDKPAAERLEGQIQMSPAAPAPPQPPAVLAGESEDDEVEEDIFGGVGEYELNIGSEDEDEQGSPRKARSPTPATPGEEQQAEAAKPRRNWFGDAEGEEEQPVVSLAGSSRQRSGSPAHRAVPRQSTSRSPSPSDEEEGNQGTSRSLPRLQPLASSAGPSARDLLAADKAAQALEKKRARKAKWRAKQGLAPQSNENGDDDDDEGPRGLARIRENDAQEKMKLNRETQKLQAYMSKKDKAKGE